VPHDVRPLLAVVLPSLVGSLVDVLTLMALLKAALQLEPTLGDTG